MGFFDLEEQESKRGLNIKGLSVATMHKRGCDVCPLNTQVGLKHPHMEPSGTTRPDIYMLGEFPTQRDDQKGLHFSGPCGEVLRLRIPSSWDERLRWNNVVRTAPPRQRLPAPVEVECCRPSIVQDIERTKPIAIFGFGAIALDWAIGERRIDTWAGKRIPVRIGTRACWFFPFYSPKVVYESRRFEPRNASKWGSDLEFKFMQDMRGALRSIEELPVPRIDARDDALRNVEYVTGRDPDDAGRVVAWLDHCATQKIVGVDYETSALRPYNPREKILTAAVADVDRVLAFPFYHKDAGWSRADLKLIEQRWRRFLIETECKKVSHHLGFEQEWSAYRFGIETIDNDKWEDSLSQAYILDERQNSLGLDELCKQYFGLAIKELFSALNKQNLAAEKLETILLYNGVDAKYHRALFVEQRKRLQQEGLMAVYEHQVQRVNASVMTTLKGFPVSNRVVEANYKQYIGEMAELEAELNEFDIVKDFVRAQKRNPNAKTHTFRPSNNYDVIDVLQKFGGITLDKTKNKKKRTEGKSFSTTEEALAKIKHPFARTIVKWRKVKKLLSTYVIPVRRENTTMDDGKVHETTLHPDGKLHPIYGTTKTRTWRTMSEDPNAQNWPKRGPAKVIRKQVEVDDDHVIVAIDYSGIQARNVAMESKDKGLIKHYWERYDIHGDWLERVLRRVPDWMPPKNIGKNLDAKKLFEERRSVIKNGFVFPTFFGVATKSLTGLKYLGVEEHHAISLHEEFFDEFPDVKQWHEDTRNMFFEKGYVTGLSGFRRRAPIEINQLINAPIQADETIIVCGAWARLCRQGDDDLIPNLMVHDDLTFIWRKKDLDRNLEMVVPIMLEQVHEWERVVPMEIEISIGQNWCDLKKFGKFETLRNGGYHEVGKDKQ